MENFWNFLGSICISEEKPLCFREKTFFAKSEKESLGIPLRIKTALLSSTSLESSSQIVSGTENEMKMSTSADSSLESNEPKHCFPFRKSSFFAILFWSFLGLIEQVA